MSEFKIYSNITLSTSSLMTVTLRSITALLFLSSSFNILAQSKVEPLLEQKITLAAEQKPLLEVMELLEKKAGISFSYSSGLIDEKKRVSVRAANRPLREILNKLFGPSIRFKERKGYIILSKVLDEEKKVIVAGYVETPDGTPVESATVYDNNSLVSANTNKYGYFELKIEKRHPINLQVSKRDYFDTIPPLVNGSGALQNVVITPNTSVFKSLSDSLKSTWTHVKMELSSDSLFPKKDSSELAQRDSLRKVRVDAINDSLSQQWSRFKDIFLADSIRMQNVTDTIFRDVQFSFVPYISTNRKMGANCINRFSLNAIAGYSMGTDGFELGGFANINRYDMKGAQIGGFANLVGRNVHGLQIGGFSNIVKGEVKGVQIGGFSNINLSQTRGLQIGGFSNVVKSNMKGIQIAGFSNVVIGEMDGIQIAGFVNYATSVKGLMIAPFNLADTLKGIPIGFLSFVKSGYKTWEVSTNDVHTANVSFRTGVRGFYNILSAGMSFDNLNSPLWSYGYGIGTSPRLTENIYLNLDLVSIHVNSGRFNTNLSLDNQFYLGAEWQISKNFGIATGAILHVYLSEIDEPLIDLFAGSTPRYISDETYGETRLQMWAGWKVALRFF